MNVFFGSQAYETRDEFARQRSSLGGINARMSNVMSASSCGRSICAHHTHALTRRHISQHQLAGFYDWFAKEERCNHPRFGHWCLFPPCGQLRILVLPSFIEHCFIAALRSHAIHEVRTYLTAVAFAVPQKQIRCASSTLFKHSS